MSKKAIAVKEGSSPVPRKKLTISRADLDWAAGEGVISGKQAEELWGKLATRAATRPGFDLATVAWYSGAVIVMIAMSWFLVEVWDLFRGGAILATSVLYSLFFLAAGRHLWNKEDLRIPGGLLVTLAVAMAPVAIFALQRMLGMWDGGAGFAAETANRLMMEGGTVVAGLVALSFFRFPFITAPLAVAVWLTGMDFITLVVGHDLPFEQQRLVTLLFGAVMIAGSYVIDLRARGGDFAFWGYLVGATAFWFSLTLMDRGSELGRFVYCLINVGLMGFAVLINRRVFVVYGAMGVIGYLGYLAFDLFADSMMFPIALSGLGLAVIFLGIKYHRSRDRIAAAVRALVPESLRCWLPADRA